MGDQAWTSIDYRLGFAIKYFLSEKGLRFQKTRVQNVSFITKQVHRLSFCLQVFSLRSSEVQPILDRTLEFDCKIPNTFVLITTEDLRLPNARFPLVVSIKTTLYPTMLEVVRKKSKFHSLSKSNV